MQYQLDVSQTVLARDGYIAAVGNEVNSSGDPEFQEYIDGQSSG